VADVTIRDVAKQAGVGIATVSRVLNNSPSVREETRQKVLEAIVELDYRPNPIARRLSLGKTLTIGVIVPFFTRPAFVERLRGIEHTLSDSEYDLIIFNVESAAKRDTVFHDILRQERVDGLLIISLSPGSTDVNRFLRANVPTVLIDDARHSQLSQVVVDDVNGGYLATQHLIELGHRKIGYVSDLFDNPFNFISSKNRYSGYRRALDEAEISFRPEYHRQGEHGRQVACEMAQQLLSLSDPPTAIFAASDTQAIGVLEAARNLGLQVPHELSVIGFDDIEVAEYLNLTTIRQPFFASGVEGVELLLEAIATPSSTPRQIVLHVELVIRDTTAPPGR
jgi:DNA-binding LacI/PurR family transcriptional regulator